jgi:DNA-binding PadR family transcriptional regulator
VTKDRTTTTYAVLGLLSVRDWTTYELAQQVRRSLNWFWPRAERKLYDEPKRLVDEGLATATRGQTGQRPRTVYAITRKGRTALRAWLSEPSAPRTTEFEAMVRVFFADAGTVDQLVDTLNRVAAEAEERLATLRTLAATQPRPFPERAHISALSMRLQYDQEDVVLRWARWAMEQVVEWRTTSDPGTWDGEAVLAALSRRRS